MAMNEQQMRAAPAGAENRDRPQIATDRLPFQGRKRNGCKMKQNFFRTVLMSTRTGATGKRKIVLFS